MRDALNLWQMLEVVSSVDIIKTYMANIVMSYCNNLKIGRTRACQDHQELWYQHTLRYG